MMLAELAAANAAFGIIKESLQRNPSTMNMHAPSTLTVNAHDNRNDHQNDYHATP